MNCAKTSTLAQGWDPEPPLAHPEVRGATEATAWHRTALSARFLDSVLVVPAGQFAVRANDTRYVFRPSSAYTYLTADHAERPVQGRCHARPLGLKS